METVTTSMAATMLGLASAASARKVLRRMGIEAVGRDVATGEKLWPAEPIRNRPASRQGFRTDLYRCINCGGPGPTDDLCDTCAATVSLLPPDDDFEGDSAMSRFTTRQDAIEQAILPALGDNADDYDIDAICRETFDYRVDTDHKGNELLDTAGFEQVVPDSAFWEIVAKHDKTV